MGGAGGRQDTGVSRSTTARAASPSVDSEVSRRSTSWPTRLRPELAVSAWTRTSHPSTDRELHRPMRVSTPSRSPPREALHAGRWFQATRRRTRRRASIARELSLRDDATILSKQATQPTSHASSLCPQVGIVLRASSRVERLVDQVEIDHRRGNLLRLFELSRNRSTQGGLPARNRPTDDHHKHASNSD